MDRLESGFLMLALAPPAWLVGVFLGGVEGYGLPLAIVITGMGLAGWGIPTERRFVAAAGLAIAAFGMAVFYDFRFADGIFGFAGLVYALACIAAIFATLAGMRTVQAVCFGALAFAGFLWAVGDLTSWPWQPGNVLTVIGGAYAAVGALRDR